MGKQDVKPSIVLTTKTMIVGALSFTTALAWRDLIRKIFEIRFGKRTSLKKYVLYALIVTVSAVLVVYALSAAIPKHKKIEI